MQLYIARQPIFNRNRDIVAYELLYRDPKTKTASMIDGDHATSSVLMISSVLASFEELLDGKAAFVNFTKNLLCDNTATLFSNNFLIIEILENVVPNENLVHHLKRLKELGYTLALDDFTSSYKYPELIDLADIIKVDFMLTSPDQQAQIVQKYSREGLKFLAEKVETSEEFDRAMEIGYDYFQGYYFAKPAIFNYQDISNTSSTCFKMLEALSDPVPSYESLQEIVETDVAMTYKLFKYADSPIHGGRESITSIREALVRLGIENIHNWVYLIILRSISRGQSNDLVSISLQRAKMLEIIAEQTGLKKKKTEYFITGLFSLLDVLTNKSIKDVIKPLPLSDEVKDAIISKDNALGKSLDLILAYEAGDWKKFESLCKQLKLKVSKVINAYMEGLEWSHSTILDVS